MSVGVEALDAEHRHLFYQVNTLLRRLDETPGADAAALHELIDDIMNYNFYHIKNEEQYMHEFSCVDAEHLAAHKWYMERTTTLFSAASNALRSASATAGDACKQFAMFAGSWHVRHIVQNDKKYTSCFNEHGLC